MQIQESEAEPEERGCPCRSLCSVKAGAQTGSGGQPEAAEMIEMVMYWVIWLNNMHTEDNESQASCQTENGRTSIEKRKMEQPLWYWIGIWGINVNL